MMNPLRRPRLLPALGLASLLVLSSVRAEPPPTTDNPTAVSQELAAARIEATRGNARLALANARQAALDQQWSAARQQAQQALTLLRTLPKSDEVTDQMLMAEGILHRAGGQPSAIDAAVPAPQLMQQVAAPRPPAPTPARPVAQQPRAQERAPATDLELEPHDKRSRYEQQARLRDDYSDDELRELIAVDEARRVPNGWVEYPPGWAAKARQREQRHPGGMIARGPAQNLDGQDWYWAVYDISDLTYVPPDFVSPVQMNPVVSFRTWMDRNALLWHGNGYALGAPGYGGWGPGYGGFGWGPWGIAVGGFGASDALTSNPQDAITIARYFGGVDDLLWRGPKYSAARQKQIEELVKFITLAPAATPQVFTLDPVEP